MDISNGPRNDEKAQIEPKGPNHHPWLWERASQLLLLVSMKKRMWRISLISQISDLLCLSRGSSSTLKTLTPFCFTLSRSPFHQSGGDDDASGLKNQLLRFRNDSGKVASVLERNKIQGAAFVELLRQLRPWPVLSQLVYIHLFCLRISQPQKKKPFFRHVWCCCFAGVRLEKKQGTMRWVAYDCWWIR